LGESDPVVMDNLEVTVAKKIRIEN
jgi:hypothetical protein